MDFLNRVLPWDGWGGRIMATVMARGNSDMEFAAVEMLNLKSDSNVAMIGCGPGIGVVECARRISSGIVIGLDPSIVMTERTRKRCCRARVEQVTKVERAAAESLPLSDRSQDALVSVNNIQLWTNRSVGLDECTRVLVPGGVIVVLLHMWAIPSVLPRQEWIKQLRNDLSARDVHVEKPRIRRFRSGKALVLIGKRSK